MDTTGLAAFFRKRGLRVHKVEEAIEGFAVYVNYPEKAKAMFDSTADSTHVVFIVHKRWWEKVLFWRK